MARRMIGGPAMETPVPLVSDAASRLFACISRFEYALKESGYVSGPEGGNAVPNWAEFERRAAENGAYDQLRTLESTRVLFEHPPSKQVRRNHSFGWSDPLPVGNMHQLSIVIRQVRNNLFHGGKAGANPRDNELCEAAAAALLFLTLVDPAVRMSFLGEY